MSASNWTHVRDGIAEVFASIGPASRQQRRGYSHAGWLAVGVLDRLPDALLLVIEKSMRAIASRASRVSREAERSRLRRISRPPERHGTKVDLANQRLDQLDIEDQEDSA